MRPKLSRIERRVAQPASARTPERRGNSNAGWVGGRSVRSDCAQCQRAPRQPAHAPRNPGATQTRAGWAGVANYAIAHRANGRPASQRTHTRTHVHHVFNTGGRRAVWATRGRRCLRVAQGELTEGCPHRPAAGVVGGATPLRGGREGGASTRQAGSQRTPHTATHGAPRIHTP